MRRSDSASHWRHHAECEEHQTDAAPAQKKQREHGNKPFRAKVTRPRSLPPRSRAIRKGDVGLPCRTCQPCIDFHPSGADNADGEGMLAETRAAKLAEIPRGKPRAEHGHRDNCSARCRQNNAGRGGVQLAAMPRVEVRWWRPARRPEWRSGVDGASSAAATTTVEEARPCCVWCARLGSATSSARLRHEQRLRECIDETTPTSSIHAVIGMAWYLTSLSRCPRACRTSPGLLSNTTTCPPSIRDRCDDTQKSKMFQRVGREPRERCRHEIQKNRIGKGVILGRQ